MSYPYIDEKNNWLYLDDETIVMNESVKMRWNSRNKKYYTDLEYVFNGMGQSFDIYIQDLMYSSNVKVNGICSTCPIGENQREVIFKNLIRYGHSKCRPCSKFIDRTGDIYGDLFVDEQDENKNGQTMWLCTCLVCGRRRIVQGGALQNGHTKSCGLSHTVTDEDREKERSPEDRQWAKDVKIRDNHTCQYCDKYGGDLESHHLNHYHTFPEERLNLDNGVTLCLPCHTNFHSWMGSTRVECVREHFERFCKDFQHDIPFML